MFNQICDELNTKDANAFKSLIKLYETKNHKKGLKAANALLENVPNHPETLSLKSIFLYLTGKQEEGYDLGKKALGLNMKSDICWHIFGIINRSNRNYKEAVKCYKFALTIAPTNIQILRDLAILQIQIRDLTGHSETRFKLLKNKESIVVNWVGCAVAEHLKGDLKSTLNLLESITKITAENSLKKIEKSELQIYEAFVLQEAGEYQKSADFLLQNESTINDKKVFRELLVENYLKLDKNSDAEPLVRDLIKSNPNNKNYHQILAQDVLKKTGQEEVTVYESLLAEYPNCQTLRLNILLISDIKDFGKKFQEYIIPYFRSCKPSLFSELRSLYRGETKNQEKINAIEKILEDNLASLKEKQQFVSGTESGKKEAPNCLLWNLKLLAQHHDRMQNFEKAHSYLEQAISHTPTLVELYLIRAKIYKHQYKYLAAYKSADKARSLDLADRYLNNKAIKYCLRVNKTEQAEALMRLFLRDPSDGNAFDLQTIWYELYMAQAHFRKKEMGAVLKQYKFIEKHFSDMYEDQFDFHLYACRRYALKSYIEMIRYEDNICNSKFYVDAAAPMIDSLLELSEILEEKKKEQDAEDEIMKDMNSKEKKAYKRDKEKILLKKQKEEDAKKTQDPFHEYRLKLDLDGKELLEKLKDPLQEANNNFADNLIKLDIRPPTVSHKANSALVDLYIVRGNELLCLKALNKLIKTNIKLHSTHISKIKAITFLQKSISEEKVKDVVKESVEEELKALTQGKTVEQINQDYIKSISSPIQQEITTIQAQFALKSLNKNEYSEKIEQLLLKNIAHISIQQAVELFDIIAKFQTTINSSTRDQLSKQFPDSDYFQLNFGEVEEVQENGNQNKN